MTLLALVAAWLLCCAAYAAGLPVLPVAPLAVGLAAALPARAPRGRGLHCGAALLVVVVGAVTLHRSAEPPNSVAAFAGQSVTLVGRATADADNHPSYSTATLAAHSVQLGQSDAATLSVSGRILVDLPAVPDLPAGAVRAGDLLRLRGTLQSRNPIAGDSGYASYLERQGISAVLAYPRVELLSRPAPDPFHAVLRSARSRIQAGLADVLPPREAAIASAMLFGNRHALPRDLSADLLTDGATHAVSFTSFNVLLLFGATLGLFAPLLGRRRAALLALGAALLYSAVAGAGVSALRGEAVALALTLAILSGRPHSSAALLALVAAALTLRDPTLIGDAGLQLTFAAAAGVAVVAPRIAVLLSDDAERDARAVRGLRGALAFGIGVSLAVAPVAAVAGGAGLLSPLANALLYPLLAPLTALAALAGALSAAWRPLAWPVAAPLFLGLRGFAIVAHACAVAPGARLALRGSGPWLAIGWYALLTLAGTFAPRARRLLPRRATRTIVRGSPAHRGKVAPVAAGSAFALLFCAQPAYAALHAPARPAVTVRWLAAGSRPAALIEGGGVRVLLCSASEPAVLAQAVEAATGDGGGVDVLITAPGSLGAATVAADQLNAGVLVVPASAIISADATTGGSRRGLLALAGRATVPLGSSGELTVLVGSRYEGVAIEAGGERVLLVEDARDPVGLDAADATPFAAVALPPLAGSELRRAVAGFRGETLLLAGAWSAADATIAHASWPGRVVDAAAGERLELRGGALTLRPR